MGFVQRELERIGVALSQPQSTSRFLEFYAAQQALSWANDPTGFASPSKMIMGILEATEGCQPSSNPELS